MAILTSNLTTSERKNLKRYRSSKKVSTPFDNFYYSNWKKVDNLIQPERYIKYSNCYNILIVYTIS